MQVVQMPKNRVRSNTSMLENPSKAAAQTVYLNLSKRFCLDLCSRGVRALVSSRALASVVRVQGLAGRVCYLIVSNQ